MDLNETNGQNINFYRQSVESVNKSDSGIPEPQSLERIVPEKLPVSPQRPEIDAMFNLILSEKQEDKNKFAQEYVQRKVDRRLKEIEDLSNEKKRRNYIEDAQKVLENRINSEYTKDDKGYYNLIMNNTPDPAYLRGKAVVMTDAEVQKQRMMRPNINEKAGEIVRSYFPNKKSTKRKKGSKKKKVKISSKESAVEPVSQPEFNTLDMRVGPDLASSTE